MWYILCQKLQGATSSLNKAWFKHQISVIPDASEFEKGNFISVLEKGVIPGWWDEEVHKISYAEQLAH